MAAGNELSLERRIKMAKVFYERRLGAQFLKTYRDRVDIDQLVPNDQQPRPDWDKPDEELQRQIEANRGLWEPILAEPVEGNEDKFLIIDGHRRWRNCRALVEVAGKEEYRIVPVEVIEHPLGPTERLMIWIYIHRQREEWDKIVKEGVAYELVNIVGRASAAAALGLRVIDIDRLCQVYEFAKSQFSGLKNPLVAITWATEILGLPQKFVTPEIRETIVKKVNEGKVTNSKDIRKLRKILRDDDAKAEFLSPTGDINSAMAKLEPEIKPEPGPKAIDGQGLEKDLDSLKSMVDLVLTGYPWVIIQGLKGNTEIIDKVRSCEETLAQLRQALTE